MLSPSYSTEPIVVYRTTKWTIVIVCARIRNYQRNNTKIFVIIFILEIYYISLFIYGGVGWYYIKYKIHNRIKLTTDLFIESNGIWGFSGSY